MILFTSSLVKTLPVGLQGREKITQPVFSVMESWLKSGRYLNLCAVASISRVGLYATNASGNRQTPP